MTLAVSPQELRHATTGYRPAPAATGSAATRPAGGPVAAFAAPGDVGDPAPTGDGPMLAALKQSLGAAGFSASSAVEGADDTQAAMHGFTNAFFDSVHAQRQADAAAGRPTGMRQAIRQLAGQAAAGSAPADLQSAFDALQQTQPPGSAAGKATLAQVLAGMATTAPDDVAVVGSLVDTSA